MAGMNARRLSLIGLGVVAVATVAIVAVASGSKKANAPVGRPETGVRATVAAGATSGQGPEGRAAEGRVEAGRSTVNTWAGSGEQGYINGLGLATAFNRPAGLAFDWDGYLYVADAGNDLIRRIGRDGAVSTFAGSGETGYADGAARSARFNGPAGMAIDRQGNLYVADSGNDLIRKIAPDGTVTTVAGSVRGYTDGPARLARFNAPAGVTLDDDGNIYVADTGNDLIRRIAPNGAVTTLAGSERGYADGQGVTARFNQPRAVTADGAGTVFVADTGNDTIRAVSTDGTVRTFSGIGERGFAGGSASASRFNKPAGIIIDLAGGLYVVEFGNDIVRRIAPTGTVTTLAGTGEKGYRDSAGTDAQFNAPLAVAIDGAGVVYVADSGNNMIRTITLSGAATTIAGSGTRGYQDGAGRDAILNAPQAVVVDGSGAIFVADTGNDLIRRVGGDGAVTTYTGSGEKGFSDGARGQAKFNAPSGLALASDGVLYVADAGNDLIRKVTPDGTVSTLAGSERGYADGKGKSARLNAPTGIALDAQGNLYVADTGNDLIRKITPDGTVTTIAGSERGYVDGKGKDARFNEPRGIVVNAAGVLFVADTGNDLVRRIEPDGTATTLAGGERGYGDGPGKLARLNMPVGIILDGEGGLLIADQGNDIVRHVSADGLVTPYAGSGERGYTDGPIRLSLLNMPSGIALDGQGNVVLADQGNNLIRRLAAGVTR